MTTTATTRSDRLRRPRFRSRADQTFAANRAFTCDSFGPEAALASSCGRLTRIRVHHNGDLFVIGRPVCRRCAAVRGAVPR